MKSTLVILTLNEIQGVTALYDKIPVKEVDECFVIDGGSTDGTIEYFKEKGLRVIVQEIKGRGEAFRIAMREASGDAIIFFSPDGNEDPKDIPKLIKCLDEGAYMTVGSRFMKGSRSDDAEEMIPYRSFGNRFFTLVSNILWGGRLTDSINGFRAIRKDKLKEINLDARGFGIEYQMTIRALKLKYRIKEIPTYEGDRIGGKSTAGSIDVGLYFIRLLLSELRIGKNWARA